MTLVAPTFGQPATAVRAFTEGATGFGTRVLLRWLSGLGEAPAVTA